MRQTLKNGDFNHINFSNSGEGFDIRIDNEPVGFDKQTTYLHFRPWDDLGPFVSAVTDYSWGNGLCEVPMEHLEKMIESFSQALIQVKKELKYRKSQ